MAYRASRRRSEYSHKAKELTLNVTSMIDMFTIILLFLLKSFAAVELNVTPSDNLSLPYSVSSKMPDATLNLVIARDKIIVEGIPMNVPIDSQTGKIDPNYVGTVDENGSLSQDPEGYIIIPLYREFQRRAQNMKTIEEKNGKIKFIGRVTLQGDKRMPFHLLKRVMVTAGQAEFGEFRFAVYKER